MPMLSELYISNLTSIRNKIVSTYNNALIDPNNIVSYRDQVETLTTQFKNLENDYESEFIVALKNGAKKKERALDAKAQRVTEAYRREAEALRAEGQAMVDATNARVDLYNSIRKQGSINGATEAGVNAQLHATGLIRQTTCSFSSVGGMTPGAGSMTCY